jgi:hypothetical protein
MQYFSVGNARLMQCGFCGNRIAEMIQLWVFMHRPITGTARRMLIQMKGGGVIPYHHLLPSTLVIWVSRRGYVGNFRILIFLFMLGARQNFFWKLAHIFGLIRKQGYHRQKGASGTINFGASITNLVLIVMLMSTNFVE